MRNFFASVLESIRIKKSLFILLCLLSIIISIFAVISAINLDGGVLPIDLSNITYIRFLSGNCGFMFLIIGSVLNLLIFYLAIFLCCSKKFLFPIAIIFYLYFVYSQVMIFTSIILIYGFFNTFILLMLLLVYLLALFFILMLIILCLTGLNGSGYFSSCFKPSECNLIYLTLLMIFVTIAFCFLETIMKSFVILLIF